MKTKQLKKRFYFFAFFLVINQTLFAQSYYPAGLGNSNLKLWLTAADPSSILDPSGVQVVNGSLVATWKDKSGNSANAVQATGTAQPTYSSNAQNGLGAVLFTNNLINMTGPTGAYQTIVAARQMIGTSYLTLFCSPALSDFSIRFNNAASTGNINYTDGPNANDWNYNTGTPTSMWVNGTQGMTSSTTKHILVDQTITPTNATYSISTNFLSRGMAVNDPVYELMAYSTPLNTTSRRLLENYEATEWGMTANLPSSGYSAFTPPTASTYNKNLVGIGYTSNTDNFLANPAGSTDGLGFSSGTGVSDFLNTPGYLMAAHNGQSNSILSGVTLPYISPSGISMWNRSWYAKTFQGNSTGNVSFNFNFSDYNSSSLPGSAVSFGLLYNATDGSFATGINKLIISTYSISGNTVIFTLPASKISTGYYTLLWSSSVTLPMVLSSFTAIAKEGNVQLEWATQQETNSAYFDVQRSVDSGTFMSIGKVMAQGFASNYQFVDKNHAKGLNNYRLGMVDLDGKTVYSEIRSVDFTESSKGPFTVYPNPVMDLLYISSPVTNGPGVVQVLNSIGQLKGTYNVANMQSATIPFGNLTKGVYYIRIKTASGTYSQTVSKQ